LVAQSIVAESQVNRCQEFTVYISEALVKSVVLDGFASVFGFSLSNELVIHSNAVIGKGLAVAIVDALADL
jgi:hypothetical protein